MLIPTSLGASSWACATSWRTTTFDYDVVFKTATEKVPELAVKLAAKLPPDER
jgi:hypothetical protein